MDAAAAQQLAARLRDNQEIVCQRTAARLLTAFPDMPQLLKLEGGISPEERVRKMAVDRFRELVRAALIFETFELMDQEFAWASGVLPRYGVVYEHQAAMIRYFFDELRRLGLEPGELDVAYELEHHALEVVRQLFQQ